MTLIRWNPRRDMMRLRNEFDRLFDETMEFPRFRWSEQLESPAVDVVEKEDAFVVKASLPGIKADDLDISIKDNILIIKGEVSEEETVSEERYHLRERRFGSFSRTIALPTSVDIESVEANYEDGVLTLTAPKTEDVKVKHIEVKSAKMLESETN